MQDYLLAISRGAAEVSTREAIGGLLVGLVLAFVGSGACLVARKRVSDPLPMLCGVILLVSVVSMAIGLGHSRYRSDRASGLSISRVRREGMDRRPIQDFHPDTFRHNFPRQGF